MSRSSQEHQNYLQKQKKEKRIVSMIQITILFLFFLLWEITTKTSILNSFLYSSPSKIISTLLSLFTKGDLLHHIEITLWEVIISFMLSTILGILIAFFLWRYPRLSKVVDPYLTIINSLPKVSLGPLIIIWAGARIQSIILMALLISLFTTIIHIYQGFISVPSDYITLMKSFQATPTQTFFKVIFPSNFENLIAVSKVNLSLCFIGVVMGELLVSKHGLGYLITYGSNVFQLDLVMSSIFLLGILSYLLYFLLDRIHKKSN